MRVFLASVGLGLVALACTSSSPGASSGTPDAGNAGASDGGADAGTGGNTDAAATGDAGGGGPRVGWQSGTRLRAVVDTAEAARVFVRWHDTALDVDCDYALATDGKTRCLPAPGDVISEYDDDHCTNPVGLVPKGTLANAKYLPPPNAAFVCGAGQAFHAPGAAYTPAALYYFTGASCDPDPSVLTNIDYVHFGAVVPPTTFVAETEASEPRGARLSSKRFVGEDDSVQDFDLRDDARGGAECDVTDDRTGVYYCTPRDRAYLEYYFADAACGTPVAFHPEYAQQVCGRAPTAVQDSTGKATVLTFYEVGAKDTAPIFESDGASCKPASPEAVASGTYYAPGAPLPLASLATLTVKNEGTGRIQLAVARTESGAFAASLDFFDSQLGARCDKGLASDGSTRCLPESPNQLNAFADAQCAQALFTFDATTGGALPPAGTLMRAQSALAFSSAVFRLAAKVTAPTTYWQWNGTTCESTGAPAVDYYATTVVAPSEMVAVTTAPE